MELVKPGLNIRVVTDVDPTRETIGVKSSTIYEVEGMVIIVGQSEPPLSRSLIDRTAMITYVKRENKALVRYGFPARIDAFIGYERESRGTVQAVRMEREGDTRPYSIRMFHRVELPSDDSLRLTIGGVEMRILDISLRGVRVAFDGTIALDPERIEDICVDVGGRSYDLKARICRTWESSDVRSWRESNFASVEFFDPPGPFERVLVMKLHQIERQSRLKKRPVIVHRVLCPSKPTLAVFPPGKVVLSCTNTGHRKKV